MPVPAAMVRTLRPAYVRGGSALGGSALGGGLEGGAGLRMPQVPRNCPIPGLICVAGRVGPPVEGEHAADHSCGVLRILKGSRAPRGKWSGQRWMKAITRSVSPDVSLTTTSSTFLFLEIRQRAAAIVSDTPCCAAQSVQTRSRVIPYGLAVARFVALRGALAPNPANLREGVERRMRSMAGLVLSALRGKRSGPGLLRSAGCGFGDGVRR
jgi:hypothetical protein